MKMDDYIRHRSERSPEFRAALENARRARGGEHAIAPLLGEVICQLWHPSMRHLPELGCSPTLYVCPRCHGHWCEKHAVYVPAPAPLEGELRMCPTCWWSDRMVGHL